MSMYQWPTVFSLRGVLPPASFLLYRIAVRATQSRIALAMQIRSDMSDRKQAPGLSRGTPSRASLSPVAVNVTASGELFLSSLGDD